MIGEIKEYVKDILETALNNFACAPSDSCLGCSVAFLAFSLSIVFLILILAGILSVIAS